VQKVNELIAGGVDVNMNAGHNERWTPLISAAYTGNVDIATLLIDKGADVNARANNGDTALSLAELV
jgi:ankyrin repeat protein